MRRQAAPQHVEVVRKAVEPHEHRRIDRMQRVGAQRRTLGTPAHRAADVAHRDRLVTARDRKLVDRGQRRLQGVDPTLDPLDVRRVQGRHLVAARIAGSQQRLDGHQPREDTVQVRNRLPERGVAPQLVGQQRHEGAQFVHRTVSLDPFVGLEHALAADERGHALVTRLRIYFHIRKCCFGK